MDFIGKELKMPILKDKVMYLKDIYAQSTGYITNIDSLKIGNALVCLGGGRYTKGEDIDHAVGFKFMKKKGDLVCEGDIILKVLYNDKEKFNAAFDYIEDAITIETILKEEADFMKQKSHVLGIVE